MKCPKCTSELGDYEMNAETCLSCGEKIPELFEEELLKE